MDLEAYAEESAYFLSFPRYIYSLIYGPYLIYIYRVPLLSQDIDRITRSIQN